MATGTFTILGDVNVEITIAELADGMLKFDIKVLDETGSIGDLNAFFFDLHDDSLTNSLSVTGDDVTNTAFKQDGVTKIDNYTNMNGEIVKDLGKFDGGIQFGSAGIGEDDIRETSFILSSDVLALTLEDFSLQDIGIRLTSVGEEGGSRDDSLKLGGTAPELTEEPVSTNTANADLLIVSKNETYNPSYAPIVPLANMAISILENDQTDEMPYLGSVTAVNGDENAIGEIVFGSGGGAIIIYPDGTVDFSASSTSPESDFAFLDLGQTATTTFDYEIEGGATATLTVFVEGVDDGVGGPIG